ncbi:MAG: hypothetical protein IJY08_03160 [Clostridia bacterium]|nr:hypothetical protein [Clostridia bacterium]
MKNTQERSYAIDSRICYTDYDTYCDTSKEFGYFSEDGACYTITDPNTPRQWLNMLYNDKFISVIANRGEGYTAFGGFYNRVTKYYKREFYIVRDLDGKRLLEAIDLESGRTVNLFDSPNIICKVRAGCSEFIGEVDGIAFSVKVFVPRDAYCECWIAQIRNTGNRDRRLRLHAQQAWAFNNTLNVYGSKKPCENLAVERIDHGYFAKGDGLGLPFDTMYGAFAFEDMTCGYVEKKREKVLASKKKDPVAYKDYCYTYVNLYTDILLPVGGTLTRTVVSASSDKCEEVTSSITRYLSSKCAEKACSDTLAYWEKEFSYNTCSLPDKNSERFLNVWLKYQLGLTYLYNRNTQNAGFRDVLQDVWGAMLIRPDYSAARMDESLSHLYSDGHSVRGYDSYAGITNKADFVDCPLWAPAMVLQYLKETGDLSYIDRPLPYIDTDDTDTVEAHLWKTVNYAYGHRGENGLLLMRDGDWLDGLAGINQNGTATSAWATMQAYWAQDCMAQIYDAVGNEEKAEIMRLRNAEYKSAVRDAAWDGKWYVYGFKSDGLPVGSRRCAEGKIYLNPQTWAIFTGIEDDPGRIKSMVTAVNTYLTTMFGPLLLYPPYVNDKTCGNLANQLPGTFANASVYLHAASFKVYSDIARGEYDEAYDTFIRLLPNHPDNSDCRRTSEPYCTGNVHFGPDSERFGMNLFSWFTATPAWLIHAGFEKMLGAEADFDGLRICPCVPSDWNEYSVKRLYRGQEYRLSFRRSSQNEKKGIYTHDGVYIDSTLISADSPGGDYRILY